MSSSIETIKIIAATKASGIVTTGCGSNDQFDANQLEKSYISSYTEKGGSSVEIITNTSSIERPKGKIETKIETFFYSDGEITVNNSNLGQINLNKGWNSIISTDIFSTNYILSPIGETTCSNPKFVGIHSHNSPNKPYSIVTFDYAPPTVSTLSPDNVNLDVREPITINWKFNYLNNPVHTESLLEWSFTNGSTWVSKTFKDNTTSYVVPPNTFSNDRVILVRVKVKDGIGLWSKYKQSVFRTNKMIQQPPTIEYPTTGFIDGDSDIRFKWKFKGGWDFEQQSKYTIQTSKDNKTWTSFNGESVIPEHVFNPGNLSSGKQYWKVKTYNKFGDESEYSEIAEFNVISRPPTPLIKSIELQPQPLIKWDSVDQKKFTVLIKDMENNILFNENRYSNTKEFLADMYLNPGEYEVWLSITNNFNLESNFAISKLVIEKRALPLPTIQVYTLADSNMVKTESMSNCRVYRNGKYIGDTNKGTFKDYTFPSNKNNEYFIRKIDISNTFFLDSEIKSTKRKIKYNTLALINEPNNFIKLFLKETVEDKQRTNFTINAYTQIYEGRQYPVVEFSESIDETKELNYTISNQDLLKFKLLLLKRKQFIFRSIGGDLFYGHILNYSSEKTIIGYNSIKFTIIKSEGDLK